MAVGRAGGCDCPGCTGEGVDPRRFIDELLAAAADLVELDDPLDAEVMGATFVSVGAAAIAEFEEALVSGIIPVLEARATSRATAMLLAIGAVAGGRAGKEASVAAERLVAASVARPGWAVELAEPVTAGECWRLVDSPETMSVLVCSFRRAGRSHAVVVVVDHTDCGAAADILLVDDDRLTEVLDLLPAVGLGSGVQITTETLDGAEFRWQVEKALDARAVHDGELSGDDVQEAGDDADGPGYPALAVLVRARMTALPIPSRPAAPHEGEGGWPGPAALRMLAELTGDMVGPTGARRTNASSGRSEATGLPPKRRRSGPPAPVYQIKVALRGTKPPIWRRLEVPADVSLTQLHTVIQVAFDWDDSHLHLFETSYGSYGSFGTDDAGLGHHSEAPVTLEQVAPAVDSKLSYTYDFGDDWRHDIVVEKVLDRDEKAVYPRCTGGRRAAPPEDCGGAWGYAELVDTLNDPDHPGHEDRLEWLGLEDAAVFEPGRFDANRVTRALSTLA